MFKLLTDPRSRAYMFVTIATFILFIVFFGIALWLNASPEIFDKLSIFFFDLFIVLLFTGVFHFGLLSTAEERDGFDLIEWVKLFFYYLILTPITAFFFYLTLITDPHPLLAAFTIFMSVALIFITRFFKLLGYEQIALVFFSVAAYNTMYGLLVFQAYGAQKTILATNLLQELFLVMIGLIVFSLAMEYASSKLLAGLSGPSKPKRARE